MVLAVAAAVIGSKSWIPAAEDSSHYNKTSTSRKIDTEQVPNWSKQDMDFFLHGSMSTEVMFLAEFEALGYEAPKEVGVRSTGKNWAATLAGVWARSPYLHNGSVRTMQQLLTAPAERAKNFHRGSRAYDEGNLGYTDEGAYVLDTAASGNSNSGHDYGTKLSSQEKKDLIEYFKTL